MFYVFNYHFFSSLKNGQLLNDQFGVACFQNQKKLHGIVVFNNQFSIQKKWRETIRLKGKSISGGIQLKGGGNEKKWKENVKVEAFNLRVEELKF